MANRIATGLAGIDSLIDDAKTNADNAQAAIAGQLSAAYQRRLPEEFRTQSLLERLLKQKRRLSEKLQQIDELLALFERNPELDHALDLMRNFTEGEF